MASFEQKTIGEDAAVDPWKSIYKLGAITALVAVAGTFLDIVTSFLPGWGVADVPRTVVERFAQFQENAVLGLRNLDLLNLAVSIILIPTFLALFAAHRRALPGPAALSLVLFIIGTTVFIAGNTALPMLSLSGKYAAATTDAQRTLYAAAGEALLARGGHGSPGVFLGFFLSSLASLAFSLVMLKGRVFNRTAGWMGASGSSLMIIYTIFVTFLPGTGNAMMVFAMPGGLLLTLWNILIALGLFKLSRHGTAGRR